MARSPTTRLGRRAAPPWSSPEPVPWHGRSVPHRAINRRSPMTVSSPASVVLRIRCTRSVGVCACSCVITARPPAWTRPMVVRSWCRLCSRAVPTCRPCATIRWTNSCVWPPPPRAKRPPTRWPTRTTWPGWSISSPPRHEESRQPASTPSRSTRRTVICFPRSCRARTTNATIVGVAPSRTARV